MIRPEHKSVYPSFFHSLPLFICKQKGLQRNPNPRRCERAPILQRVPWGRRSPHRIPREEIHSAVRNEVTRNNRSTGNCLVETDATDVPAAGRRGAQSKTAKTSHGPTTESATLDAGVPAPSASVRMRSGCEAEAWPQLSRNFFAISYATVSLRSRVSFALP